MVNIKYIIAYDFKNYIKIFTKRKMNVRLLKIIYFDQFKFS